MVPIPRCHVTKQAHCWQRGWSRLLILRITLQPILAIQYGLRHSCNTNLLRNLSGPVPSPLNWNLICTRLPGASMPRLERGGSQDAHCGRLVSRSPRAAPAPEQGLAGTQSSWPAFITKLPLKERLHPKSIQVPDRKLYGTFTLGTNYKGEGAQEGNLGG